MTNKANGAKRKRPLNTGAKSKVAQSRRDLYAKTLKRINEAMETGFVLEAVTLLESVIADRLEARIEKVGLECGGAGKFWSLTQMARTLAGKQSKDDDDAKAVYRKIPNWATRRNRALHGLGKLATAEDSTWDEEFALQHGRQQMKG